MSYEITKVWTADLARLRGSLVYIAGPYRSTNGRSVLENIRAAERVAIDLARAGVHFVCPHLNTAFMGGHGDHSGVVDDDAFWLEMDLNILRRCDAVLLIDGWCDSAGALGEVAYAAEFQLPIFEHEEA